MRVCKAVALPEGQHVAFGASLDDDGNVVAEAWLVNETSNAQEIARGVSDVLERLAEKPGADLRPKMERQSQVVLRPTTPRLFGRLLSLHEQVG